MRDLKLNREIYSLGSIQQAAHAYKDFAQIKISDEREAITVSFANCKYDEARTLREFENYLIGIENA